MIRFSQEDSRLIGMLLRPSWISGFIAVVIGLTLSVGVVVSFEANNSLVQQHLLSYEQKPQPVLTKPGQNVPENTQSSLKSNLPLLLLWGFVGFLVYLMIASVIQFAAEAEDFKESLDYVNARPKSAIASTAEHVLMRVVAGILLVTFTVALWRQIGPYSVTAALAGVSNIASFDGGLYALLSFGLIAFSLHVETILLRLTLGRVRVFSTPYA